MDLSTFSLRNAIALEGGSVQSFTAGQPIFGNFMGGAKVTRITMNESGVVRVETEAGSIAVNGEGVGTIAKQAEEGKKR